MPQLKPQLDINKILQSMGYGYLFSNPFATEYGRDPKNAYRTAWDAYDKMLAWDPELAALDKLARMAVLAHDTEIVAATEDAESEKAAEFCREMISNIPYWDDILYDLLDSPAKGMAVIQKNYVRDGSRILIADGDNGPALQTLPQYWFYWKPVDGVPTLVYRGSYGGEKEQPLDPENFIIARHGYTVENPYGRGYLTEAFWTFVTKKIIKGCMVQLVKRGVEVERWVQCIAEDVGKEAWNMKDIIRDALSDFARYSDIVLPPGAELHHQPGDQGALQSELNFTHLLDNYEAKLVLGQTLTTDQGRTGSYELGKIHELQQNRFTISRCKDRDADISDQLLTPVCELNFNVGRAKFKTKYEPERDRKEDAEILERLGKTVKGLRTTQDHVHYAFDLPRPEPNAPPEEIYEITVGSGGGSGGGGEPFGEPFGGFAAVAQKKKLTALATKAARQDEADKRVKLVDGQVARYLTLVKGTVDRRFKEWRKLIDKSRSYDDLMARVESRAREWPAFAGALRTAAVASYALGMATQATQTAVKAAAIAAPPEYDTWEDVLRAFKDKVPISAEVFYSLDQELRAKYFATAIAEDDYMATVLHSLMTTAIEGGETFSTFKAGAYEGMRAGGYTFPEPYRLETVFRRHISTADAAARDEWYEIPEVAEMLWGFVYTTSGRPNVRPSHASLNKTKLPKEHPFWNTNSPPNAYG